MPILNGFEATKSIRKLIEERQINKLNIVGTTANVIDRSLKKNCIKTGFDDIISKPIMRKDLRKIIYKYHQN